MKMPLKFLGSGVALPASWANVGFLLEGRDSRTYVKARTMCIICKKFLTCVELGPEPEFPFCFADMEWGCCGWFNCGQV